MEFIAGTCTLVNKGLESSILNLDNGQHTIKLDGHSKMKQSNRGRMMPADAATMSAGTATVDGH